MLDLRTGFEKRITPFGTYPDFAPSGDKFVCFGWEPSYQKPVIKVVDTTGVTTRVVYTDTRSGINSLAFSPDGRKIAFSKPLVSGGEDYIWVVRADGSNPRRITKKGGLWPSWSPDGKKIVYTRLPEVIVIGVREFALAPNQEGIGDLYIINADGSGEKRLTYFYPR